MLFAFPPFQADKNWLNPMLVDLLRAGMKALDGGELPEDWPNCLPIDVQEVLEHRTGLRDRVSDFWEAYMALSAVQKAKLKRALDDQTNIPGIFGEVCPCETIVGLPNAIESAASRLFRFAFDQLKTLEFEGQCIRDIQYKAIYDQLEEKICPFCGLNHFRAPDAPRHPLDHYLPVSRYAFVGSDFRNLVPCCHECNSDFKRQTDPLFADDGTRRLCCDPYAGPIYRVCLQGSTLFEGATVNGHRLPRWAIEFKGGDPAHAQTWDHVFRIKERYARDILNVSFVAWVGDFAKYFVDQFGKTGNVEAVYQRLPEYIAGLGQDNLRERAFLKTEVLRLIYNTCHDGANAAEARMWLWEFAEWGVR